MRAGLVPLTLLLGLLWACPSLAQVGRVTAEGVLDLATPVRREHLLAQGLLAWWLCLPGLQGGLVWREVTHRTDATLSGIALQATSSSGRGPTTRPGGFGEVRLDGTDDFASAPQSPPFVRHALPFTVMAWVLDDTAGISLGTFHRILSWYDDTTNIQLGLGGFVGTTQRGFYLANAATGGLAAAAVSAAVPTGWHHIAATFDGTSTYALYLDGQASTLSDSTTVGIYTGDATTLYLGQRGDAAGFLVGALDDVRIYTRAVSASLVQAAYLNSRAGLPGVLRRIPLPGVARMGTRPSRKPVQWNWLLDSFWRYAYVP